MLVIELIRPSPSQKERKTEPSPTTSPTKTTSPPSVSTTIAAATTTGLTFDDVKFDSFDDEDYGQDLNEDDDDDDDRERGSGSSSSSNREEPFNVKAFWDWG